MDVVLVTTLNFLKTSLQNTSSVVVAELIVITTSEAVVESV